MCDSKGSVRYVSGPFPGSYNDCTVWTHSSVHLNSNEFFNDTEVSNDRVLFDSVFQKMGNRFMETGAFIITER